MRKLLAMAVFGVALTANLTSANDELMLTEDNFSNAFHLEQFEDHAAYELAGDSIELADDDYWGPSCDEGFDDFVSPISNPFFFEDPRSLTETRGLFLSNSLPATVGGGDLTVWAAQVRARITRRLSLIAPRLAYLDVNQSEEGAPYGYLSSPIGLKYNLYRDVDRQVLLTGGTTYFVPGSSDALSAFGEGDFHFFLTGGREIGDGTHWLSATGFRIPANRNWGTQLWYWSNQWDHEFADDWYGVLGLNWFHWMSSGWVGDSVTALDLIDIPAKNAAGTDVVSAATGVRWKPSRSLELGAGFEVPVTEQRDILRNRLYIDVIVRF